MITPEIIGYIKTEREKTTPDATIRSNLQSNGWSEKDIAEAFSVFTSGTITAVPKPSVSGIQLSKYREKIKWNTFVTLIIIDALIIFFFKITTGNYGLFGMSWFSLAARLLAIYLIAMYSAREATIEESKSKAIAKGVAKVIGTVVITIVVAGGIFFAGCMFIILTSRGF